MLISIYADADSGGMEIVMGLFDKLFEKKECAICGGEIGLLGNRKLEDGNMCKDCAKKLSPLFSERRHSTVAEIKEQLLYREENEKMLASFNPTVTYGHGRKVHIDMNQKKFIVTYSSNWRGDNPDLISFSQVTACNIDIKERKDEIYDRDKDGNRVSYNPPRYEYSYSFWITINVNSPYFDEIEFELSDDSPDSPYTELYRQYEREAHELQSILLGQGNSMGNMNMGYQQPMSGMGYNQNPAPAAKTIRCDKCGFVPEDQSAIPKFCPNCGDPITMDDIK